MAALAPAAIGLVRTGSAFARVLAVAVTDAANDAEQAARIKAEGQFEALAVLLLAGITWGLHPQFSWDVDNTAPGSVLKAIAQKFGPHWSSSYGPIPYFTMALPMIPMLVGFKFSHELGTPSGTYPWGFAHPDFSVNALTLGARATTVLAALLIVAMAMREARRRGSGRAWVAALLLAGSATFTYYARTSNVDVHYLFWAWAAFHLAEHGRRARTLALAGLNRIAAEAAQFLGAVHPVVDAIRRRGGRDGERLGDLAHRNAGHTMFREELFGGAQQPLPENLNLLIGELLAHVRPAALR